MNDHPDAANALLRSSKRVLEATGLSTAHRESKGHKVTDLDPDISLEVVLEALQVQLQHSGEGVKEVAELSILQCHRSLGFYNLQRTRVPDVVKGMSP